MPAYDIVIFGGTGDLSLRKLMPALYFLFADGKISKDSRILAVSNEGLRRQDFQNIVTSKLQGFVGDAYSEDVARAFSECIDYRNIELSQKGKWSSLVSYLGNDKQREKIYYLAVPPTLFGPICNQLNRHRLNPSNSRVVVEKPLGEDVKTSEIVNGCLLSSFREEQIYRIDHYLGKEAIQNLLALRFSNTFIGAVWNNNHIENFQITVSEEVGVEGRAGYLDRAGVLRDMVQNHLMQIVSCLAMEAPLSINANDIRDEKVKAVRSIRPITLDNVNHSAVRAQYTSDKGMPGYLEELDASPGRHVGTGETFVALKLMIDNDRWSGVPFYLRTGKRLSKRYAQIVIQFKPTSRNIFNVPQNNRMIINLQPDMDISFELFMKKILSNDSDLSLNRHASDLQTHGGGRVPDAYEKLLGDVFECNQAFFVRHDEIIASWKLIDAVRDAWEESDLIMDAYVAGSMGPEASDALLAASGHHWHGEDK